MRVLLLASTTGYQTRAFDAAAERLGISLVLATDRCDVLDDPWRDRAIPVRFHDPAFSERAILARAREQTIHGVIAAGDRPAVLAARVAAALKLPGHPPTAAAAAGNKRQTRDRLRAAGLLTPSYIEVPVTQVPDAVVNGVTDPVVVKPLGLSGSRGVMRADTPGELVEALHRLGALLASKEVRRDREIHDRILIERFIHGREYAVEGLMTKGTLSVLALFDKPDPLDGPFFEETIYVTPSCAASTVQTAIADTVAAAARALGLSHGPIHAECRVNEEGVWMLEIAARPIGGLCARALRFVRHGTARAGGPLISLEELLLRHAVGERVDGWKREPHASGVMMIPIPARGVLRAVSGEAAARAVPGVEDVRVTAKLDQLLVPLPEGASYLGFIFARGTWPEDVEQALRDAHECLDFVIAPEVRVLQSAHG